MTEALDPRFEQDLRRFLADEAPATVPAALREAIAGIPYRSRRRVRPFAWAGRAPVIGAVAAAGLIVAIGVGALWIGGNLPGIGGPVATASPSASPGTTRVELTYRVVPGEGRQPTGAEVQAASDVLLARASSVTGSATVSLGPDDTIIVGPLTVPADDASALDAIRSILGTTGHVAFVPIPDGATPEPVAGQPIDLARFPPLFTDAVESARRDDNPFAGPGIDIVLKPLAADAFAAYTRANIAGRFAIAIDGQVVAVPTINEAIEGGEVVVTLPTDGGAGAQDPTWLAAVLDSGPLPVPVEEVIAQP